MNNQISSIILYRQRVDKAEAMSLQDVVVVFATLFIPLAVSAPLISVEMFVEWRRLREVRSHPRK